MEGFFWQRSLRWVESNRRFVGHTRTLFPRTCESWLLWFWKEWSGMVYQDVCFMKPQRIRQWQTRFESFNLQPTTELNCKGLIPSFSSFLTSHIPHVTLFLSAPSLPDLVFSGCRSNRPWRCYTLCCRRRAGRGLPDDDPVCIQGTPDSL